MPTTPTDDPNATTGGDPGAPASAPPAYPVRYRLGEEIARGGMGAVFRATDAALGREVAVKVLQDRFALTSGVARRFADEAQITGQLQHPNIPPVYDVGVLPDGRPFLAMKLIKGETLDDLLKARRDPAADRGHFLGVFEKVCEAVAYAHAHDVIHRDLKPANVMVGAFGEVQVMDWGLAKVLTTLSREAQPSDPDATAAATAIVSQRESDDLQTQAGSVLGTPAYMAPEQAIGAVDQLDRRTDVFGLGGILAVILTGQPPFVGPTAESTRQQAAARKLGDCFARLDGCGAEPELVALCQRCLAGEQDDRPADAKRVAEEVAALRAAADDRARRAEVDAAAQRSRRRVLGRAAGAVAAVLLLGLTGTAAGLYRADQARRAEAEQRAEADRKRAEADAVAGFVVEQVFAAGRPKGQDGGLGRDVSLRAAITASLPALAERFRDHPLTEARFRLTLGTTFGYLEDFARETEQAERALALYREHLGPDHPDTVHAMGAVAASYTGQQRDAEARRATAEHVAVCRRVFGPEHPNTVSAMTNMANAVQATDGPEAAQRVREEQLAIARRVYGPDHPETVVLLTNLALGYYAMRRPADAARVFEEQLAIHRRVGGPDHDDTLSAMNNLALMYRAAGRHADAMRLSEEVLAARRRTLPPDHPTRWGSVANLALIYSEAGRSADAVRLYSEATAVLERAAAANADDHAVHRKLGGLYYETGEVLYASDRPDDALAAYTRSAEHLRPVLAAQPDDADAQKRLAKAYWGRAVVQHDLGRFADAVPDWDRAVELLPPKARPLLQAYRAYTLARAGQVNRATSETDRLAALPDTWPAEMWYNFACVHAVAAGVTGPPRHADRAMELLRRAAAAGYTDAAHMWQDADLDPLRGRPDFQQLLVDLGAAREPAPTPRRVK